MKTFDRILLLFGLIALASVLTPIISGIIWWVF